MLKDFFKSSSNKIRTTYLCSETVSNPSQRFSSMKAAIIKCSVLMPLLTLACKPTPDTNVKSVPEVYECDAKGCSISALETSLATLSLATDASKACRDIPGSLQICGEGMCMMNIKTQGITNYSIGASLEVAQDIAGTVEASKHFGGNTNKLTCASMGEYSSQLLDVELMNNDNLDKFRKNGDLTEDMISFQRLKRHLDCAPGYLCPEQDFSESLYSSCHSTKLKSIYDSFIKKVANECLEGIFSSKHCRGAKRCLKSRVYRDDKEGINIKALASIVNGDARLEAQFRIFKASIDQTGELGFTIDLDKPKKEIISKAVCTTPTKLAISRHFLAFLHAGARIGYLSETAKCPKVKSP